MSYLDWLPYQNKYGLDGPSMSCIRSNELENAIGIRELWVSINGYSPKHGSYFRSGSFKECEAIGVLNRVNEETDKILIVSSAGNAGKAFLELAASNGIPSIIIMPECANPKITVKSSSNELPLLILIEDGFYPDAIKAVDFAISNFSEMLVREGGCFNVARRDSMAVPFLRSILAIGDLPDRYIQAVGSGTGSIAAWEAVARLKEFALVNPESSMKLTLVQNSPFTPMVDAWKRRNRHIKPMSSSEIRTKLSQTKASVLSNANPPYNVTGGVYDCLAESNGSMEKVSNNEIVQAKSLAKNLIDFTPCDAASAALAGLIKGIKSGSINSTEKVLINLTGGGIEQLHNDYGCYDYFNTHKVALDDSKSILAIIKDYLNNI